MSSTDDVDSQQETLDESRRRRLLELAVDESDPWDVVIEREERGSNRFAEDFREGSDQ